MANIPGSNVDFVDCDVLFIDLEPEGMMFPEIRPFLRDLTKTRTILDAIKHIIGIKTKADPTQIKKVKNNTGILVEFENAQICNLAYAEWKAEIEKHEFKLSYDLGRKLFTLKENFKKMFKIPRETMGNTEKPPPKKNKFMRGKIKSIFKNVTDINETYGLSMQFLTKLGITLPLGSRIHVGNLNPSVDVTKIREVFGLAGYIVHASMVKNDYYTPPRHYAKVHYDHPVEAVQAISMFDKQILCSHPMTVKMDTKPDVLPEGLPVIGPGLGIDGVPLKGVRFHVEFGRLKNLLNNGTKNLDANNMNHPNVNPFPNPVFTSMASQAPMVAQTPLTGQTSMGVQNQMPMPVQDPNQMVNPFGVTSMMNPINLSALQVLQMLQSLNQLNPANIQQMISNMFQNNTNTTTGQNSVSGANSTEWLTEAVKTDVPQQTPVFESKSINFEMNTEVDDSQMFTKDTDVFDNIHNRESPKSISDIEMCDRDTYNEEKDNKSKKNRDRDKSKEKDKYREREKDRYKDKERDRYKNKDKDRYKDRYKEKERDRSKDRSNDKCDMLLFKNLPKSVTVDALKNKMREVGDVKWAELTGQGRALVRFSHPSDAKRCIKMFDRSRVDGYTIEVRFF